MMETDVFSDIEVERESKMKAIEYVTFIEIWFSYMKLVDSCESSDLQLKHNRKQKKKKKKKKKINKKLRIR